MKARGETGASRQGTTKPAPSRPSAGVAQPASDLLTVYRNGLRSRTLDERFAQWSKQGLVGFYLPADEWGGPLAALAAALRPRDWLFPGLREARMALWTGLDLAAYLAQHLGLAPPVGAALPTFPGALADSQHRVASVSGGPAAHLPQAVGAAYAFGLRKEPSAVLAVCSGAAMDAPDFHVACNFAGVWKVPVVLAVRLGPPEQAAAPLEARGDAYGLAVASADGADLEAVQQVASAALQRARDGAGPTLLGIASPADADGGLGRLRRKLGNGSRPDDAALRHEALGWCDAALALARSGHRPGVSQLIENVYAARERHLDEELADLAEGPMVLPDDI